MARFEPRNSPRELLRIVAAVARHVAADAPASVSTRAWDRGRKNAGFPDAPSARAMTQRFDVEWVELLDIALGAEDDRYRRLTAAASARGTNIGLTLDRVLIAMRQVALSLGRKTITRDDYRAERERMLGPALRAGYAAAASALPALTEIDNVLRLRGVTWEQALQRSGLVVPTQPEGLDGEAAAVVMASDLGAVPSGVRDLRAWARIRNVRINTNVRSSDMRKGIARVQAEQVAAGKPELPRSDPEVMRRAESLPPISDPAVPKARLLAPKWDRERIIAGMAEAVRQLRGAQLDQRSLKRIAKEGRAQRDLTVPSYSTVHSHLGKHPGETFEQWVEEAERVARAASRPAA